jgi:hypothetical protein
MEFNRKFNFVSDDILTDFVARSKTYENYSIYEMNFIHDEIVDNLME